MSIDDILKVDMINDVSAHFRDIETSKIFSRVDNVENILSNKLTAVISRDEPKDVVDIITIAKNTKVDWIKVSQTQTLKRLEFFLH